MDHLTDYLIFAQLLGQGVLASQPSLSRFWTRFDLEAMAQVQQANQELLDNVHRYQKSEIIIFDLDSIHVDLYGNQEDVAYNAHYETVGFHPATS